MPEKTIESLGISSFTPFDAVLGDDEEVEQYDDAVLDRC